MQQAAHFRHGVIVPAQRRQAARIGFQTRKARTANPRGRAFETARHHRITQADDFKQARTAVTGNTADTHLRQDLEQTFFHPAPIAAPELLRLAMGLATQDAAPAQHMQGLIGQIRIHRGGTKPDQAGEVVRVTRGTGFDDEVGAAAQPCVDQMLMHRTRSE